MCQVSSGLGPPRCGVIAGALVGQFGDEMDVVDVAEHVFAAIWCRPSSRHRWSLASSIAPPGCASRPCSLLVLIGISSNLCALLEFSGVFPGGLLLHTPCLATAECSDSCFWYSLRSCLPQRHRSSMLRLMPQARAAHTLQGTWLVPLRLQPSRHCRPVLDIGVAPRLDTMRALCCHCFVHVAGAPVAAMRRARVRH